MPNEDDWDVDDPSLEKWTIVLLKKKTIKSALNTVMDSSLILYVWNTFFEIQFWFLVPFNTVGYVVYLRKIT